MGNDIKRAFWEERNPILSNATRLRGRQTWGVNDWINTESQPPGREAAECAGPGPGRRQPAGEHSLPMLLQTEITPDN